MNKLAFVFPGQGSQYIGMGRELFQTPAGKRVFEVGREILGEEFLRIMETGPEDALRLTFNAQPLILLVSIAAWQQLEDAGIRPDYLAGHSLGEYSAHVAAGNITLKEALQLVCQRGELMHSALPEGQGIMAAVLGISSELVEQACREAADSGIVVPANYNCPGQVVISGERNAVFKAIEKAKKLGAKRALPLAVSGPFHSPLMKPAADRMAEILRGVSWNEPMRPVIANIDALEVNRKDRIIQTLIDQISGAVCWEQSIKYLAAQGVDTFIECGPGKVINGLIKKTVPGSKLLNIEDQNSLENSLAYLKESR